MAKANKKKVRKTAPKKVQKKKPVVGSLPKLPIVPLLIVLVVTVLALIPMLFNGFTNWDDTLYVVENKLLLNLDWQGLKEIFAAKLVSNYHPLTVLSLALNYQVSGLNAFGYHLTDMVLHLLNVGLVYYFIYLLSKGNLKVSLFVAFFFAIHPMHVESVAWVSERKDLLYTFFFVLGLIQYLKYRDKASILRYIWIVLLFAASLLSKPAAVVFPVVLLVIDYYRKEKWNSILILEKVPLFIMAIALGIATLQIQSDRAMASLDLYSIPERIGFAGFGYVWYLVKVLVPTHLSALHPFPVQGTMGVMYYGAPVIALATVVYILFFNKSRLLHFGLLFYLVTIALVLQIVSVGTAVVAERYTYVPYIGIFFTLGMFLDQYLSSKEIPDKTRKLFYLIIGIVGLGFCFMTFMRTMVWKDSPTLWNDVIEKYPNSHRAFTNRGLHYYSQENYGEALNDLNLALEAKPTFMTGIEWRGKTNLKLKNNQAALQDAELWLKYKPREYKAFMDKGRALQALKRNKQAETAFTQAINLNPGAADAYNARGVLYFNKLKEYDKALNDFQIAISINPSGTYYLNMARCYYMKGDNAKARELTAEAQRRGAAVPQSFVDAIKG